MKWKKTIIVNTLLVSLLSFGKEQVATVTVIKLGIQTEKEVIPVFDNLTNEEILSKYRPTNENEEIKGEWWVGGNKYSYSTTNKFQMCKYNGDTNICLKWGIAKHTDGYIKEYGNTIDSVAKGNEVECQGEDSYSVKILRQKDNHFIYGVQSCKKRTDGKENTIKEVGMSVKPVIDQYEISIRKNRKIDKILSKTIPEDFNTCEGNPCDVITGNKIETSVDYPHPEFPIVRVYQSNMRYKETGIGAGWSFNFESNIQKDENDVFKLIQGGQIYSIVDQQVESFPNSLFIKKENEYLVILKKHIYRFDVNGRLLSISDFYKEKANFEYENNLISKIHVNNGSFKIKRIDGRVNKIITPEKKELSYNFKKTNVYSGEYNLDTYVLDSFKDVLGNITGYEYESLLLTGRTNKSGKEFANWEYNEAAQVTKSKHGVFDVTVIDYKTKGNKEYRTVKTPTHTNKYEIKDGIFYKKNKKEIKSKTETTDFHYDYLKSEGYGRNLISKITNKKSKETIYIEYTNDNKYGYYLEKSISNGKNKIIYHYDDLILNKVEVFENNILLNTFNSVFDENNMLVKSFINGNLIEEYTYHEGTDLLKEHKTFEDDEIISIVTYDDYNHLSQPKTVNVDGDKTIYSFNDNGQITSLENDRYITTYILDQEGNKKEIIQKDKKDGVSLITIQTFDNWNHLKTKSYADYKEVFFYNPDNTIKKEELFYKNKKIEEKTFDYKKGDLTTVKSKNEPKFYHDKTNNKNGVLHRYTVNNVTSEMLVNKEDNPEYIKVRNNKLFDFKYTDNTTKTVTANNVTYLEKRLDNSVVFESNEYGKEEYIKDEKIITINRNNKIKKEHYSDNKIIKIEKEGDADILYTYPKDGVINVVKGDDSLNIEMDLNKYKQTQVFEGKTSTFEFKENTLIYPSGNKISYITDEHNVITGVSFNDSVVIKDMVFNGGNDYHSFEYGNGIKVSKEFDYLNIKKNNHIGLFEETISIDNGRINTINYSKANEKDRVNYRFKYDEMNQLDTIERFEEKFVNEKREQNSKTLKRKFDKNGNILKNFSGRDFKYKKNSNKIDSETVDYDVSGNMTLIDNMVIIYGDRNEIKEVFNKEGQLIAEYSYNLKGERSKAFYPLLKTTKYFYYDYEGKMIEEEINGEFKSFIYLNWKIIGYTYKGELFFNHYSVENIIKATSDINGNVRYFDYGFESIENDNFVMYLGQYKDEVTGLYYNYNRDYSHKLKRYLQIDPLKLYDGSNPYIYVGNNHINYFDFYGLEKIIMGIHASGDITGLPLTNEYPTDNGQNWTGHTWISIIKNDSTTTYGYWPNDYGLNGYPDTMNKKDSLKYYDTAESRYYEISEKEYNRFIEFTKTQQKPYDNKWWITSNCSTWVDNALDKTFSINPISDFNMVYQPSQIKLRIKILEFFDKTSIKNPSK